MILDYYYYYYYDKKSYFQISVNLEMFARRFNFRSNLPIQKADSIGNLLIGKSVEIEMDLLLRNPVSRDCTLQYAENVRLKIILFFIHPNPHQLHQIQIIIKLLF